LIVGPSTTWICWAIASSASRRPTSYAVCSLQDDASSVALGSSATTRPPLNFRPRTPVGPSDRRSSRRPIDSSGASVKEVAPVSSRTLAGRSSLAMRAAWSDSGVVVMVTFWLDRELHV
jgi:hypothetical protein